MIQGLPNVEKIFIEGDLNDHVGKYIVRVLKEYMEAKDME